MTHDVALDPDEDEAWDGDPNPEIVHWQPVHSPDGKVGAPSAAPARALGLMSVGSTAFGALAIGALAIGALAIGRLVIGHARIRKLEIDELVVGRVRFHDDG